SSSGAGPGASPGPELDSTSSTMGDAHAQQIRDQLQSLDGSARGSSTRAASQSSTSSGPQNSSTATSNRGSGRPRSSGQSSAPRASRYNIASWGADRAARLATQGAVSGANAVGEAGSKAMSAVKDPVKTAGAIGR